jgi:hypothetical protein
MVSYWPRSRSSWRRVESTCRCVCRLQACGLLLSCSVPCVQWIRELGSYGDHVPVFQYGDNTLTRPGNGEGQPPPAERAQLNAALTGRVCPRTEVRWKDVPVDAFVVTTWDNFGREYHKAIADRHGRTALTNNFFGRVLFDEGHNAQGSKDLLLTARVSLS